jgi:hypothetical protein
MSDQQTEAYSVGLSPVGVPVVDSPLVVSPVTGALASFVGVAGTVSVDDSAGVLSCGGAPAGA